MLKFCYYYKKKAKRKKERKKPKKEITKIFAIIIKDNNYKLTKMSNPVSFTLSFLFIYWNHKLLLSLFFAWGVFSLIWKENGANCTLVLTTNKIK